MDSMTAVEIKETLEREFDVYLTPQEIRTLTLAGLNELSTAYQSTKVNNQQLEGTLTILVKSGKLIILEKNGQFLLPLTFYTIKT
jgi:fatty acid synthase